MALEFLLLAFLENNQPITLGKFAAPLGCEKAIDELSDFNRLHQHGPDRILWEIQQRHKAANDSDYEPLPYPEENKLDPVSEIERLVERQLGQEVIVDETVDVWEGVPILTRFITDIKYRCIAAPKQLK